MTKKSLLPAQSPFLFALQFWRILFCISFNYALHYFRYLPTSNLVFGWEDWWPRRWYYMFLSIESRVHRCRSRNQNLDSNLERSDFEWSLRSFSVVLSLVKNLSEDVSLSGLYQQMWKIRSSRRIFPDFSGLWEFNREYFAWVELKRDILTVCLQMPVSRFGLIFLQIYTRTSQ